MLIIIPDFTYSLQNYVMERVDGDCHQCLSPQCLMFDSGLSLYGILNTVYVKYISPRLCLTHIKLSLIHI